VIKIRIFTIMLVLLLVPSVVLSLDVSPLNFNDNVTHNSIYSNHFIIVTTNTTDVNIYYSSPFIIDFSETNLYNLSSPKEIDFNITIPKYFNSGTYDSYIFIEGENQTEIIDVNLKVLDDTNYTISNESISLNVSSGDTRIFFTAIENHGNTILILNINNNCSFLDTLNSIRIYPSFSVEVPVLLNIDNDMIGNYTCNVTYGDKTQTWNVDVKDDISPKIVNIFYPKEVNANDVIVVQAEVYDNVNISSVDVEILNKTYNSEITDNLYKSSFRIKEIGNITGKVKATDVFNNTSEKNITIEILPRDNIKLRDFKFLQILQNSTISEKIFEIDNLIDLNVTLEEFSFQSDTGESADYELYVESNNERNDLKVNETLEIENTKEIYLCFNGKTKGYYSGKIKIDVPEWVGESVYVNFSGKVGDLTIPENYEGMIGDRKIVCEANMVNNSISESSYRCYVDYPIDTKLDNLGIFYTKEMIENYKNSINQTVEAKEMEIKIIRRERNIFLGILIAILIISIIYYIFEKQGVVLIAG